ncbi:MAG: SDR family oxidoreductase [Rhodocyclaceae bacterium]|nr:SDR family oxidoreductase [Rhodocyclaceae bacterium]MBR4876938.1 SDR family oxidoreductase [Rhodocyclaceae bacterium]
MTLQDKTYIVTGASSGIGKATCIKLASEGASIILVGRNEETLRQALADMTQQAGQTHYTQCCDLALPETIAPAMQQIKNAVQRPVDGLVYCAGIGGVIQLRNTKPETLHARMSVNFYSFLEYIRQLAGSKQKNQEMRIIALSSLASTTHSQYFSAYAASKAAVESAVRTLSAELMRKNIYIFSIRAAFVASPMTLCLNAFTEGGFDQHLRETGKQPMGLLSTDHTSDFIHYLLSSPTAPYMTGTNIPIPAGTPC